MTDLTVVELDGEAVIYDEETTELHHLNPTATIVFGLCDGSATMAEMAADISAAFGVPVQVVEPQVRAFDPAIPKGAAPRGQRARLRLRPYGSYARGTVKSAASFPTVCCLLR